MKLQTSGPTLLFASTNAPNSTILPKYTLELDWIVAVSANILLFLLTSWMTLSLIDYGIKTGKWRQVGRENSEKLSIGMVYISTVACAVTCLMYYICTVVYMNIGYAEKEDLLCEIIGDICINVHGGVVLSVYMFLWLRQRVFFTNEMLSVRYSTKVKFCSFFSIFAIFAAGFGVVICVTVPKNHHWSNIGCVYRPSDYLIFGYWISVIVYIVLGQVTLLGLFFYALQSSKQGDSVTVADAFFCCRSIIKTLHVDADSSVAMERSFQNSSVANISSATHTANKNAHRATQKISSRSSVYRPKQQINVVRRILRKTLLFALLSVLAELFNQIGMYYLTLREDLGRIDIIAGNVNIFLNMLFCLFSFVHIQDMIFSCCTK